MAVKKKNSTFFMFSCFLSLFTKCVQRQPARVVSDQLTELQPLTHSIRLQHRVAPHGGDHLCDGEGRSPPEPGIPQKIPPRGVPVVEAALASRDPRTPGVRPPLQAGGLGGERRLLVRSGLGGAEGGGGAGGGRTRVQMIVGLWEMKHLNGNN